MGFKDRVHAANAANQKNAEASSAAARQADERRQEAAKAAMVLLPEVNDAIRAVQGLARPSTEPAEPGESAQKFVHVTVIEAKGRYRVSQQFQPAIRGTLRKRVVREFDCWRVDVDKSAASATLLIRPRAAEVRYFTAASTAGSSAQSIEAFAKLGRVSWGSGMFKDSTWSAGELVVTDMFNGFLDAAAALVAHCGLS